MSNAFNERYEDIPDGYEPTELEVSQAENLNRLEAELAELRAGAQNPATIAVEQPAQASAQEDKAKLLAAVAESNKAIENASNPGELIKAVNAHNALVTPKPAPPPVASMTPDQVRQAVDKASEEATSVSDLTKRLNALGLVQQQVAH
jgi:hypothetical protein